MLNTSEQSADLRSAHIHIKKANKNPMITLLAMNRTPVLVNLLLAAKNAFMIYCLSFYQSLWSKASAK